jgi:FkbM family methyltransferase
METTQVSASARSVKGILTGGVRRVALTPAGGTFERLLRRLGHAFPDARLVRWLCFHAGEALRERDPGAERLARMPFGAELVLPLSDYNGRHLYFHGIYEPHVTALVRDLLQPGEVALDVGANNGYFTALFACLVGPGGRVHAVEANPVLGDRLRRMIDRNRFGDRVLLHRIAASDRAGTARFYLSDHLGTTGMASLVRKSYLDESVGIEVPTATLDAVLAEHGAPEIALMKMDIEGAEITALHGMEQTLRLHPPRAILCEVSDNRQSLATEGTAFADDQTLIAFLRDRDYTPFRVVPGGLAPYTGESVEHAEFCFVHGRALSELTRLSFRRRRPRGGCR